MYRHCTMFCYRVLQKAELGQHQRPVLHPVPGCAAGHWPATDTASTLCRLWERPLSFEAGQEWLEEQAEWHGRHWLLDSGAPHTSGVRLLPGRCRASRECCDCATTEPAVQQQQQQERWQWGGHQHRRLWQLPDRCPRQVGAECRCENICWFLIFFLIFTYCVRWFFLQELQISVATKNFCGLLVLDFPTW